MFVWPPDLSKSASLVRSAISGSFIRKWCTIHVIITIMYMMFTTCGLHSQLLTLVKNCVFHSFAPSIAIAIMDFVLRKIYPQYLQHIVKATATSHRHVYPWGYMSRAPSARGPRKVAHPLCRAFTIVVPIRWCPAPFHLELLDEHKKWLSTTKLYLTE